MRWMPLPPICATLGINQFTLIKETTMDLGDFQQATRQWLESNCPDTMRTPMVEAEAVHGGQKRTASNPDAYLWLDKMAAKGWTAPTWPTEYGGANLSKTELLVLLEELNRINARPPLLGMGITMIGPTLLEYGNDHQKKTFLPAIARGDTAWCQGYSEPGAGSDLASLTTKAEDQGDYFLVNGAKIWTSGADKADWMFCLVRTDPTAAKHDGISFILLNMSSPGVSVKPIRLINGQSPFCETFFDDVQVPKENLIHKLNQGWTVGKRLLQHERSGLASMANAGREGAMQRIKTRLPLNELTLTYQQKLRPLAQQLPFLS